MTSSGLAAASTCKAPRATTQPSRSEGPPRLSEPALDGGRLTQLTHAVTHLQSAQRGKDHGGWQADICCACAERMARASGSRSRPQGDRRRATVQRHAGARRHLAVGAADVDLAARRAARTKACVHLSGCGVSRERSSTGAAECTDASRACPSQTAGRQARRGGRCPGPAHAGLRSSAVWLVHSYYPAATFRDDLCANIRRPCLAFAKPARSARNSPAVRGALSLFAVCPPAAAGDLRRHGAWLRRAGLADRG